MPLPLDARSKVALGGNRADCIRGDHWRCDNLVDRDCWFRFQSLQRQTAFCVFILSPPANVSRVLLGLHFVADTAPVTVDS